MYETFHGFESLPFENTADPRFFFATEQHREALAAIEYTIRLRKGFALISGAVGSGKTTVARTMRERCRDLATLVHVTHGHRTPEALLRQVLRALGLSCGADVEHAQLLDQLHGFLQEQALAGRPVVLLVDEAQALCNEALEELRLLSNFDTATQKLVQVVLIGQPELRRRLCTPQFEALRQRIVMSKQLRPLELAETAQYIEHRVAEASVGQAAQVTFEPGAVQEIHRFTGGIPRLINVACDNCLLLGYVRQTRRITGAIARKVTDDMMPTFQEPAAPEVYVTPRLSLAEAV